LSFHLRRYKPFKTLYLFAPPLLPFLLFSLFSSRCSTFSPLHQLLELRQSPKCKPHWELLIDPNRIESPLRSATSPFRSAHQNSLTCAANAPTERCLLIPNSDYLYLQSLLVGSLNRALQLSSLTHAHVHTRTRIASAMATSTSTSPPMEPLDALQSLINDVVSISQLPAP
jgi:hypothetical protein